MLLLSTVGIELGSLFCIDDNYKTAMALQRFSSSSPSIIVISHANVHEGAEVRVPLLCVDRLFIKL
jgi:hypothetical protein